MDNKRYCLRLPSEISRGVPPREINEEELNRALLAEEAEDEEDEDAILSRLLLAARHGDAEAAKELREFLGDVE
jgi:hypothetical protein